MSIIALYNPVSGNGSAKSFFDQEVLPLLERSNKPVAKVVATEQVGHAGEIIKQALESAGQGGKITVVLGSGDGTLHEIVGFLSALPNLFERLFFVLVPCGTANALYSSLFPPSTNESTTDTAYRLQSVRSFIDEKRTIPLTLAISTLSSPPSAKKRPTALISTVVVSTCLHASILKDSESLRAQMPGIERFKVAAQQNIQNWYNGHVKLLPAAASGQVEIYDPETKSFIPHPDGDEDEGEVIDVYGPFAYFLSTVNVDRLEPEFRISPLAKDITPLEATCDLLIVRPLRDPSLDWDNPESRAAFVPKLSKVLGDAYKNGVHVDLLYDEKGELVTEGDGPPVVEYVRCGGWEWVPDDADEGSHILCTDGFISTIEKGGRVVCRAATPQEGAGFMVYA